MGSQRIEPDGIAPPAANYAHAVLSDHTGRILHTSGVVPIAPDGSVPAGVADQAAVVWSSISAILAEASMGPADIVSVVTYVVVGEDLGSVMTARDVALEGNLVASTLVYVPNLAQPAWKVEVAVVAVA
ncbi:MAG: RidA family protein [Actinobacteria bacterium]|jgi:enamine deaminase RidA (YjgF/YER057c/UK114 family)|nr:RidA family protein [Actinomycetota bacterium]MBT3686986.1 RidA family protein [Actinomycetota bacterium]MBT4037415.1 RidA family protein [Actinomycetota bacterium]MBT4279715.1 RidA family protein [Actinomycetota bacterium]MBT4342738.1 RidA family protein [Actinomycetota bacterium]